MPELSYNTAYKTLKNRKKLNSRKTGMLRSIGKQSGESVELARKKKKEGHGGNDLQKRRF